LAFRHLILAAIALAVIAALAGCGNNPVAVVDGVKITEREFTDRLVETFGRDMLRDMIDRELIRQAAQDAGIEVTEEDLTKEIDEAKAQFPSEEAFNQWLAGRDLTQEEWREHVQMAIVARELALKDVQYTEEDLRRFFEENKERYARPATVSLSEIVVNSEEDAEEVLAELKGGEASFGDVARRYSLSPTRERGGERPELPIEQIPIESIREAAQTLPTGEVSGPISAEGQWYIIQVRDRKASREGSWEEDREAVEEHFKLSNATPLQEILRGRISSANIRVLDPRFQELNEMYTPVPSEIPQFGVEGGPAPVAPGEGGPPPVPQQPEAPAETPADSG